MKLTPHFSLREMLFSQEATRKGIDEQFAPEPHVVQNLNALCVNILEPLRLSLGVPIRVTSGYRCPRLNKAIGGATNSQHTLGQAADIEADGVSNLESAERIIALKLPFDQMILEYPNANGEPSWIHVSYGPRHRRQVLVARKVGGRTVYEPYEELVLG